MAIAEEGLGPVLLLAPRTRLDAPGATELERLLEDRWQSGYRHFVIDLAGVDHISSSGLRVLLALAQRLDSGAGSLRLCALAAAVRKVFDTAGFTALFDIHIDRSAALDRHPHRLEAAAALVKTAAGLLGAGGRGVAAVPDQPRADLAAALLGAAAEPSARSE